ncbi:hypothetical protein T07_877 [Trichinella nelsoni]|uniref:Uncharacterized protein n=1 Tax=Trichinella nelsoni TaxID=6336 RepID=A0A0V0RXQ3_9BILA|nr:hypothetical protein T07_877 [Trichinella nelsoni]
MKYEGFYNFESMLVFVEVKYQKESKLPGAVTRIFEWHKMVSVECRQQCSSLDLHKRLYVLPTEFSHLKK